MKKRTSFAGLEKRKFSRLNDPILICAHFNSAREIKALTKDISAGGLMFETTRFIQRDTLLEAEIYQPICSCKSMIFSIPALMRVVWIEPRGKEHRQKGENTYTVGGEFLEIKEEDRQRIAKYVREKMAGQ